jgi:hypothetical protein
MLIILTREQLYERVWETPIDMLRKEFGIPNVGLARFACRQTPRTEANSRGDWRRASWGSIRFVPYDLVVVQDEQTIHNGEGQGGGADDGVRCHGAPQSVSPGDLPDGQDRGDDGNDNARRCDPERKGQDDAARI